MKNYKIIQFFLSVLFLQYSNVYSQKDITSVFPLKWKTSIGITTYRTNIIETNGSIYIGSNGGNRNSDDDSKDGVYKINSKTGTIEYQFKSPLVGDNDVTGIALSNSKLYFGSDNYYFYCHDIKSGKELWKFPTPYDVESKPALLDINGDGNDDVVFCVENNGVYALNGIDGTVLWEQSTINSHNGNVPPLLIDCNNDGMKDIVIGMRGEPTSFETAGFKMAHYGDFITCLNGKNGAPLWANETGAGIHSRYSIVDYHGKKMIATLDCYGEFHLINLEGETERTAEFGYGNFSSPIIYKDNLCIKDLIISIEPKHFDEARDGKSLYLTNRAPVIQTEIENTISATTMIADILNKGFVQAISLSEKGEMSIQSINGGKPIILKFSGGAEASIFIKDIDGDGKLELLIANLDGYLYCYDTASKGTVYSGEF